MQQVGVGAPQWADVADISWSLAPPPVCGGVCRSLSFPVPAPVAVTPPVCLLLLLRPLLPRHGRLNDKKQQLWLCNCCHVQWAEPESGDNISQYISGQARVQLCVCVCVSSPVCDPPTWCGLRGSHGSVL